MKKIIVLASVLLTAFTANSQEVTDALRYAQTNLQGTARFSAMSGAFGALGGDFSALNVNPAGSAIFSNNQAGGTLSNSNTSNNSEYFGTNKKSKENSFDLNQAGGVFVFEDNSGKSDWKKFAIALNYENTNNFDNSFINSGTNPNNSIANYFLSYANGVPIDLLETQPNESIEELYDYLGSLPNSQYQNISGYGAQQALFGYQSYLINLNINNPNNNSYLANNPGGNYFQENTFVINGYNGKLTFNGAASYKDKLLIGVNFNSHFSDYRQTTRFYESNNNSETSGLRNLAFRNDLYTYGSGFSMNLGAIVKVNKEIRAGLAWESPTWYTLNDELTQSISSEGYNYGNPVNPNLSSASFDPNITSKYAPYKLQTPSKVTGSFAYIFGKKGLISVDYAIKDYSNTKFKDNNEGSIRINQTMTEILDKTEEVRIGAEYRFKQFSFRAGHRREQSPYKNNWTVGNLRGYSAGVGYNFGDTKLDISYNRNERTTNQGFFQQGFTDAAKIKSVNNTVALTLLFEL
jgi:hypothetical protein